MSDLILRDFAGHKIRHRADGFMSLTDMCQANGKLFGNWHKTKEAKDYLKALQDKRYSDRNNGPIQVDQGGTPSEQGTWGDRRVAMRLAQWISPEFAIQVDEWVVELMEKGAVTIAQSSPQPQVRQLPAPMSLADYGKVIEIMGLGNDPMIRSLMQQRVCEHLGGEPSLPPSGPRLVLVAVRAAELGIPVKALGLGGPLGTFIKKQGFPIVGQVPHGKYMSNTYELTPALDKAILGFFQATEIAALGDN